MPTPNDDMTPEEAGAALDELRRQFPMDANSIGFDPVRYPAEITLKSDCVGDPGTLMKYRRDRFTRGEMEMIFLNPLGCRGSLGPMRILPLWHISLPVLASFADPLQSEEASDNFAL